MTSQQPQEPQHTQPTRIRDLPLTLLEKRFSTASLALDYGAAIVRVRSRLGVFVRDFQQVYGAFAVADAPPFADFHTEVCGGQGLRSFLRPQSRFLIDGIQPFDPFPKAQALPHFEWGVNWCFAQRFNQHVLLHAGALAPDRPMRTIEPGTISSTVTSLPSPSLPRMVISTKPPAVSISSHATCVPTSPFSCRYGLIASPSASSACG